MKRTPLKRKSATKKKRRVQRCSWGRCKTQHVPVVVGESERYCKTHGTDIADTLCRAFILNRDRYTCQRCTANAETKQIQWAHVHSRGARYIRWDEENSLALCAGCHQHFTLSPHEWEVWLEINRPGVWMRTLHREIEGERRGDTVDIAAVITDLRLRVAA